MKLPTAARKALHNAITLTVSKACEVYGDASGKGVSVPLKQFMVAMLSDTVDFILDSAMDGKMLSPKDAATFALKKALNVAGLGAKSSQSKMLECGIAIASLALTTIDTAELEEACAVAGSTGFASPAAAVVAITGALYWAYQTLDTVQTCTAAFTAPTGAEVEAQFPADYGIASERACYVNYSNQVCRQPDEVLQSSM